MYLQPPPNNHRAGTTILSNKMTPRWQVDRGYSVRTEVQGATHRAITSLI